MDKPDTVVVDILKQARFLDGPNPHIGILQLSSNRGAAHYAVTREGLLQLAKLMTDNAERVAAADDASGEINWPN